MNCVVARLETSLFFFCAQRERNSVFEANAYQLLTALVLLLKDVEASGKEITIEDFHNFLEEDEFLSLLHTDSMSEKAKSVAKDFATSLGWKEGKPKEEWGDFCRQYSYAKNYLLDWSEDFLISV